MKIFITSKIYDTDVKPITDIEKEVQNDLDNYVGANMVIFKLNIKRKTATITFYRCVDYSSLHADPVDMIIDADAYMITGEGYEGFRMQCPFYKIPYGYSYSMEQSEFLKANHIRQITGCKSKSQQIAQPVFHHSCSDR